MDGAYITIATITSIQRTITDITNHGDTVIDDSPVVPATAVFDTLQTDGRWDKDSTGYNFRNTVAGALLALAEHTYRVEYKFTGSGGQVFWEVYELFTEKIRAM